MASLKTEMEVKKKSNIKMEFREIVGFVWIV
jgi:hypothetical protein